MHEQALPRFAASLCRFLTTTRSATGQRVQPLSDDQRYRLNSLLGVLA